MNKKLKKITFNQLANLIGIDLVDLIGDEHEAEDLKNELIYWCSFIEDLTNEPELAMYILA